MDEALPSSPTFCCKPSSLWSSEKQARLTASFRYHTRTAKATLSGTSHHVAWLWLQSHLGAIAKIVLLAQLVFDTHTPTTTCGAVPVTYQAIKSLDGGNFGQDKGSEERPGVAYLDRQIVRLCSLRTAGVCTEYHASVSLLFLQAGYSATGEEIFFLLSWPSTIKLFTLERQPHVRID